MPCNHRPACASGRELSQATRGRRRDWSKIVKEGRTDCSSGLGIRLLMEHIHHGGELVRERLRITQRFKRTSREIHRHKEAMEFQASQLAAGITRGGCWMVPIHGNSFFIHLQIPASPVKGIIKIQGPGVKKLLRIHAADSRFANAGHADRSVLRAGPQLSILPDGTSGSELRRASRHQPGSRRLGESHDQRRAVQFCGFEREQHRPAVLSGLVPAVKRAGTRRSRTHGNAQFSTVNSGTACKSASLETMVQSASVNAIAAT